MELRSTLRYLLVALLVVILGAFTGWYLFLRSQSANVATQDAARGFNTPAANAPFSTTNGVNDLARQAASSTAPSGQPQPLWRIAAVPSAGVGFATTTSGLQVRYVERATGYVFGADPRSGAVTRLTNTLSPKIYEALFGAGGGVIERSMDASGAITTFAGRVDNGTSTALTGTLLQKNITAVATDGKHPSLVYLQPQGGGISIASSSWDGSKAKQLFASPLPNWRVSVLPDGRVALVQKASDSVVGYAYALKGGTLTQLLPAAAGLTVLPRSGTAALLYGISDGSAPIMYVQLSATSSAVRLPIADIADKCVWAPDTKNTSGKTVPQFIAYCAVPSQVPQTGFLDAWYRGEVHSSDVWWKIDASAGKAQVFFTPPSNMPIDVKDPVIDDSGSYIAFINNTDLSPWVLRLNQ